MIFTRRLGNDTGHVRLLLVCLPNEDDVLAITSNAKMLRHSVSARNVYINRNLSKEEAHLAYKARCWRRKRQQQNQGRQRQYKSLRASLSAGAVEFVPTIGTTAVSATTDVISSGAVDGGILSGRHR